MIWAQNVKASIWTVCVMTWATTTGWCEASNEITCESVSITQLFPFYFVLIVTENAEVAVK